MTSCKLQDGGGGGGGRAGRSNNDTTTQKFSETETPTCVIEFSFFDLNYKKRVEKKTKVEEIIGKKNIKETLSNKINVQIYKTFFNPFH